MRTVYLGTSEFAAEVLKRLADSPHRPTLVVTRPDRPAGRGRRLTPPPVADLARSLDLPLAQPENVNEEGARAEIAAVAPDIVVVCAFGALIREELLAAHDMLNVHPSLLPRWRGAAPIERAMMAGDPETGVAIMRVTAGLDSGPVCLMEREPILGDDTFGTLSTRLAALGGELLVRALDEQPAFEEQSEDGVTYAEKITAEDRVLDPARPAAELDRVVRALSPHIGARLALPGGSDYLGVWGAQPAAPVEHQPGWLGNEGGRLVLSTADGALELLVVQPPGKRAMPAADYLRGHALTPR